MQPRPDTEDYLTIFIHDLPIMDVRAPVEFKKGAFPASINFPLMDDEERHQVGICYKKYGQDSAIGLGHQLVYGEIKQKRIEQWLKFAQSHPEGYLYCFRGGLRSLTTQSWIKESGIEFPLIKGGYKAMRRFLIDQLDHLATTSHLIILGGQTGTGKTRILQRLPNNIDLEGLANHRGSSFGRRVNAQPTQINFENALSIAFLKARHLQDGTIFLEDEGRLIGKSALPIELKNSMARSSIIVLEASLDERIEIILEDYVIDLRKEHEAQYGSKEGFIAFQNHLLQSLERIQKRLGRTRAQEITSMMANAFKEQLLSENLDQHRDWIKTLLVDYYDPMYQYQLSLKQDRILFTGSQTEILEWGEQHKNVHR